MSLERSRANLAIVYVAVMCFNVFLGIMLKGQAWVKVEMRSLISEAWRSRGPVALAMAPPTNERETLEVSLYTLVSRWLIRNTDANFVTLSLSTVVPALLLWIRKFGRPYEGASRTSSFRVQKACATLCR